MSGEYTGPLVRKTVVLCPMVSTYVTARLERDEPLVAPSGAYCFVTAENHGDTPFTLQLQQTDNHVSGPRFNLGNAVALVPGGAVPFAVTPTLKYLEVKSASGNGELRLQLETRQKWNILGFPRGIVADPVYPEAVLASASYPTLPTS